MGAEKLDQLPRRKRASFDILQNCLQRSILLLLKSRGLCILRYQSSPLVFRKAHCRSARASFAHFFQSTNFLELTFAWYQTYFLPNAILLAVHSIRLSPEKENLDRGVASYFGTNRSAVLCRVGTRKIECRTLTGSNCGCGGTDSAFVILV